MPSGAAGALSIRMYPSNLNDMVLREGFDELDSLPKSSRGKLWRTKSKRYFRAFRSCRNHPVNPCNDNPDIPCNNSTNDQCTLPYILCESTHDTSALNRRVRLNEIVSKRTPWRKRHLVEIETIPFFNAVHETCFITSLTPKVARRIALKSCESEDKRCKIHPLMPMLKISQGTVSSITQSSKNNDIPMISIIAELSPSYKGNEENIALDDLAREVIERGSSVEDCRWQVEDAFPSTGASIGCEQSLESMDIDVDWMGESVAVFNIRKNEAENALIQREKALRFISGLSIRGEVSSIEDGSDSYYIYY